MMHPLLFVSLFPIFSMLLQNSVVGTLDVQSIINDLTDFNISCTDDNCQDYQKDSLPSRACHCGIHCAQLGTCCFDSPYVDVPEPELKPTCEYVRNTEYYFLVAQCTSTDSVWASLCNSELGEEDYVLKLVPVTSLMTNITYKNYYCFRCYETTDEFLYWTLEVNGHDELPTIFEGGSKKLDRNVSLIYDGGSGYTSVMASYDEEIGNFSVLLSLQIPSKLKNITYGCVPNVISSCSDSWTDEEVRNKCQSYMAIKTVERPYNPFKKFYSVQYRNVHCALCNYENLTDVYCDKYGGSCGWCGGFAFTYLLDINRSDGELVGKIQKCSDDHIWDRFTKKCRKLECAIPGFKVKNWKCVQE